MLCLGSKMLYMRYKAGMLTNSEHFLCSSYTFSAVQENTDVYWRFQRYDLVQEYFSRPPLVPPIIILSHIFLVFRYMIQKFCGVCLKYRSGEMSTYFSNTLDPREVTLSLLIFPQYLFHTHIFIYIYIFTSIQT